MAEPCPPFDFKIRPPRDVAVTSIKGLVADRRGGFILELRGPEHDDCGQLNLFGGKVEGQETLLQAYRREVRQELHAGRVPARQLHQLTQYVTQKPEGAKLNVMVCWQVRDTARFRMGDGGPIVYFPCAAAALENDKVAPWLKFKTQMVIELALAQGLIRYDLPRRRRMEQGAATRRMLAARNKLILKKFSLS